MRKYVTEKVGEPTLRDILSELEKPGRDPRAEFTYARFATGINEIQDLSEGMVLEGVVTNVANFGAFVDIGVHQDGLVHISQMANHFVKDPKEIVQVGQVVKVIVIDIQEKLKRIGLSMRLDSPTKSASTDGKRENSSFSEKSKKSEKPVGEKPIKKKSKVRKPSQIGKASQGKNTSSLEDLRNQLNRRSL